MSASSSILNIDDVSVRFGGIKALTGVSFAVREGSVTAIIGPNGAGKTTMFNCITGFYRVTSGAMTLVKDQQFFNLVEILGEPFHPRDLLRPLAALRKIFFKVFGGSHEIAGLGIARTFQNIRLFEEMSVMENLLVARHRHLNRNLLAGLIRTKGYLESEQQALATARQWLKIVGLEAHGDRLAGELPYGHQRRLEIARAMCTGASLICLDEPAAGLNHKETAELSRLISGLRSDHGVTVLVIEHDMSLVMDVSDEIIVLDHGEVIATGTPDEIKKNKRVLEAYLGEGGDDE